MSYFKNFKMDAVFDFKTDQFSYVELPCWPDVSSEGSLLSDKMFWEKMFDKFQNGGHFGYHKGMV